MEVADSVKAFLHKNNFGFVQNLFSQVSPTSRIDIWHLCHSGSIPWDSSCHPQYRTSVILLKLSLQSFRFFFPGSSLFFISTMAWYPNFLYTCLFTGSSSPLLSLLLLCTHNALYLFFFLVFQINYFFFWFQQLLEFICLCHKAGVPVTSFPNIWLLHLSSESATLIISFHPLAIVSFLSYSEDVIPCFPKFTYHGIRFKETAVISTEVELGLILNAQITLLTIVTASTSWVLTVVKHWVININSFDTLKTLNKRIILLICPL